MQITLLAGAAMLAFGALPATAQDTTTTNEPPTAPMPDPAPTTPDTPDTVEPMTPPPATEPTLQAPATPPTPETPAAPTTPPTAEASAPSAPTAGHDTHFAQFDGNSDGALDPLEFAMMTASMNMNGMTAADAEKAKAEQTGKKGGNAAVRLMNASEVTLSQADTNHDFKVSKDESSAWHASI